MCIEKSIIITVDQKKVFRKNRSMFTLRDPHYNNAASIFDSQWVGRDQLVSHWVSQSGSQLASQSSPKSFSICHWVALNHWWSPANHPPIGFPSWKLPPPPCACSTTFYWCKKDQKDLSQLEPLAFLSTAVFQNFVLSLPLEGLNVSPILYWSQHLWRSPANVLENQIKEASMT